MWWNYIIFGGLIALGIWFIQRKNWHTAIRMVLSVITFFLALLHLYIIAESLFLDQEFWYNRSPIREIIFFIIMLLGMVARYVSRAIEKRREQVEGLRKAGVDFEKPKLEWDVWEFSYPSPPISV
jgi:4-amino-4-deoxy-L-arabinose transferase-like glycosyltransferase